MNSYIAAQCQSMMNQVLLFKKACEMAALKNDGTIDAEECKLLKKIDKISDGFIKDLQKMM